MSDSQLDDLQWTIESMDWPIDLSLRRYELEGGANCLEFVCSAKSGGPESKAAVTTFLTSRVRVNPSYLDDNLIAIPGA